jgi:hypothetical protein
MNVSRGLNRLWVLLTVLWFVGVAGPVWDEYQHQRVCSLAVLQLNKEHPDLKGDDYQKLIPPGCNMFDDLIPSSGELLYLLRQRVWTLSAPVIVWLLGYGLLWVLRGFRE